MHASEALIAGHYLLTQAEWNAWKHIADQQRAAVDIHLTASRSGGNVVGAIGINEIMRELSLAKNALRTVENVLSKSKIVEPAKDNSVVDLHTVVEIQRYNSKGKEIDEPIPMLVGGYGTSDPRTSPPTVGYESLLLLSLMGKTVGASSTIRLRNGEINEIEVVSISLPNHSSPVQLVHAA